MAPDVDLRSTAIALRLGLIQPIGKRCESLSQCVINLSSRQIETAVAEPACDHSAQARLGKQ